MTLWRSVEPVVGCVLFGFLFQDERVFAKSGNVGLLARKRVYLLDRPSLVLSEDEDGEVEHDVLQSKGAWKG